MSDNERAGLEGEERVARVLRRPVRDIRVAPFARVEARLRHRTSPLLAVLATVAAIVLAVIVGGALAEHRGTPGQPQSSPSGGASIAAGAMRVSPNDGLQEGQTVTVHVQGFPAEGKVRLSECASAGRVNTLGCGEQLAAQPFLLTDASGAADGTFHVKATAASGPPGTTAAAEPCAMACVLVATSGAGGVIASAPIAFAAVQASPSAAPGSPLPSGTPIPLPNTAQLTAPSGDVVWAIVGESRLLRSTDRGATWDEHRLPSPPMKDEISFTSDREGWLLRPGSPEPRTSPLLAQCNAQLVELWHTSDAGDTWTQLAPSGIADFQCKSALSFVDATHGFLSAWDPNHAPVVYRTADGGLTWNASQPLPDPPGFTTRGGGFSLGAGRVRAFGATLLVEAGGSSGSGQRDYVFTSTDGGATWQYLVTLPQPEGFAFVTATRWLQISDVGALRETTDAGQTWHPYASDYGQAAPIAPTLVFGDAQVGYATVRGAIQRTVDGGAHWTVLHTSGT